MSISVFTGWTLRRTLGSGAIATMAATVAAVGLGCTSQDRHVFESPVYRPTTITVLDAVSREPIWSYDIPGGHILTIDTDADLQPQSNYTGGNRATAFNWQLRAPNSREGPFDWHLAEPIESGEMAFDEPRNLLLSYDIRRPIPAPTSTQTPAPVTTDRSIAPGANPPGPAEAVRPVDMVEPDDIEEAMAEPAEPEEVETIEAVESEPMGAAEPEPAMDEPAGEGQVEDEIDLLEGVMDK